MFDDLVRAISDVARGFQERLSVNTVYGQPISADGVTVVPVARISFAYGGGGGGGSGTGAEENSAGGTGSGGGGGGGGGGSVRPAGYIEITANGSRWVAVERSPTEQMLRLATVLIASLPVGGRRGLLGRLAFFATAQALLSVVFRPRMPSGALPFVRNE